uniref:Uncharacterized protein n=1 Tax=Anguilla anguilla TaxID=7936 RepID=A0A0E9XY82_ANGAN
MPSAQLYKLLLLQNGTKYNTTNWLLTTDLSLCKYRPITNSNQFKQNEHAIFTGI